MKKINHIQELANEKRKLKNRQNELEKAIQYDWKDLKYSLGPKKWAGLAFSKISGGEQKNAKSGVFAETLSRLAAQFTEKAVGIAEEKIVKKFFKGK
jgi:flavodoxin